jgi:hypothetical protein
MRSNILAKVLPMIFCSLIIVAAVTPVAYASEACMAIPVHGLGMQTCMPEPEPGIIMYALGLAGVGVVALRSRLGR